MINAATIVAWRIMLCGRLQGIGLRPAVANLAHELNLAGTIKNTPQGVVIEIEGGDRQAARFLSELSTHLPPSALIKTRRVEEIAPVFRRGFRIDPSPTAGPMTTHIPPDVAVCAECLREVARLGDRRRDYSFTSCTLCGPRYSIIESMPYDRARTTMAVFDLCPLCRREYQQPVNRRFHAQTNACPNCGPHLWCSDTTGQVVAHHGDSLSVATQAIQQGQIVALRGIGGYQLLVDATCDESVRRLRERKHRVAKPLAILVESLDTARQVAALSAAEQQALAAAENPIVLARARTGSPLANAIHPGLADVGLMLPTTPLHWQLAYACGRPLVATSANQEGQPLAVDIAEAQATLAGIADLWLHHDRPIKHPVDDSVVRVNADRAVTLRLARGLAPCALPLRGDYPLLALGGQQKSAIAVANGSQAVLGPHIGDLDEVSTCQRWAQHVDAVEELYGFEPQALAIDSHPDYFATCWAAESGLPLIRIQHHHAHAVAAMVEHDWLDRPVLGVIWDGTGNGPDGTIWGGEFLRATASGYERIARLRPFPLPGGETAVREPWRVAVALVKTAIGDDAAAGLTWEGVEPARVRQLLAITDRERFSPLTSSMGRLFDGIAALALSTPHSSYEGQPAMLLESACDEQAKGHYELLLRDGQPCELDWRPLVMAVIADRAAGVPPATIAMRFHRALAAIVREVCERFPTLPVVLGGGVFQNRVLVELIAGDWPNSTQPLGLPGRIPPNDGGLAAGQLASALARIGHGEVFTCV